MPWEEAIEDAKKRHRPRLKQWDRDGFATRRSQEFENLRTDPPTQNTFQRFSSNELSTEEFINQFERPSIPVIFSDVPQVERWSARYNWAFDCLEDKYSEVRMKCGEDDDGYSIRVKFRHFMDYIDHQTDDSPLYIFDSSFDDNKVGSAILNDYKVPKYFPDDLFRIVGEKRRPPYRWFLVGPKRSGTCVHIDPLGTSAWNTVLSGRKLWVLFPPGTSKKIVKGKKCILKGEDDEAINYFVDILPRIKQRYNIEPIQFIQYPFETVFIPGGWWHAVLNLDDTIAVTQNFCSQTNFPVVWRETRTGRKKMCLKWLKKLDEFYPELGQLAREINQSDNFEMDYSKLHKKKHKKEKKHKEKKHKKSSYDDNKTSVQLNNELGNFEERKDIEIIQNKNLPFHNLNIYSHECREDQQPFKRQKV